MSRAAGLLQSVIDAVKALPVISSLVEREHAKMTVSFSCMSASLPALQTRPCSKNVAEQSSAFGARGTWDKWDMLQHKFCVTAMCFARMCLLHRLGLRGGR